MPGASVVAYTHYTCRLLVWLQAAVAKPCCDHYYLLGLWLLATSARAYCFHDHLLSMC